MKMRRAAASLNQKRGEKIRLWRFRAGWSAFSFAFIKGRGLVAAGANVLLEAFGHKMLKDRQ